MRKEEKRKNKQGIPTELGTESIGKLLMQYSIPAIIAMTASSLYNITDSIFIGHGVGALAISGLAITFPLMNLAAAFGSLVGVGASTLLSLRLGQRDYQTANNILGNVVVMSTISGLLFSIVTLLFLDPILYFFGASDQTIPYARDFMRIILVGNVVTHTYLGLNAMLRSAGFPRKAMIATIITVVINLILNPLFIFGFGWGIKGSALATVTSQVVVLCWQIHVFSRKDNFIRFQRGTYKLQPRIVKDSLKIGIAPFLMNAAASVIVILINQGLITHGGDLAVGAYGIVNRISTLFVMVVMGLNQGMQPIAGYNYGAGLKHRVLEVYRKSIVRATIVVTIGFLIAEIIPSAVASIFTTDHELIDLAVVGMRFAFMCYPLIGINMVTSTLFQSIGKANKAILLSISRQVLFLIPCLIILPNYLGITGVWISIPLADTIAVIISILLVSPELKKLKAAI